MGWRALLLLPLIFFVAWQIALGSVGPEQAKILKLKDGCEQYLNKALPAILLDWDYKEWEKRASRELLNSTDLGKLRKEFRTYRTVFGRFRRIENMVGAVNIVDVRGKKIPTASYSVMYVYKHTHISIVMKLVNREGGWKFQAFSMRPSIKIPID